MCVYVPREGLTCAARRKSGEGYGSCVLTATRVQRGGGNWSPQRGLTCAETRKSGEGYGSCVLMGFRLQLTIPPLPRLNLLQAFCTLQNRIRLQPISTVNSFYKIVPQNCKKRGAKEGKWGSLQCIDMISSAWEIYKDIDSAAELKKFCLDSICTVF